MHISLHTVSGLLPFPIKRLELRHKQVLKRAMKIIWAVVWEGKEEEKKKQGKNYLTWKGKGKTGDK